MILNKFLLLLGHLFKNILYNLTVNLMFGSCIKINKKNSSTHFTEHPCLFHFNAFWNEMSETAEETISSV